MMAFVSRLSQNLVSISFYSSLAEPGLSILVKGISKSVSDEDDQGKTFAGLVGTGASFLNPRKLTLTMSTREIQLIGIPYGSVGSADLGKHPRLRGGEPLLVFAATQNR